MLNTMRDTKIVNAYTVLNDRMVERTMLGGEEMYRRAKAYLAENDPKGLLGARLGQRLLTTKEKAAEARAVKRAAATRLRGGGGDEPESIFDSEGWTEDEEYAWTLAAADDGL